MVWKIQLGSVWRVLLADGWHDVARSNNCARLNTWLDCRPKNSRNS